MKKDALHSYSYLSAVTQNNTSTTFILLSTTCKKQCQPYNANTFSNLGESQSDGQECLNRSAARSQWFNDLSAAGEWSHSNILFWLVLRAPLRVWLTWFWLARVPLKSQPAPSYWQDPGGCPHGRYDPAKDLWNQTRWARRITYWGSEGRDVTAHAFRWNAERRRGRGGAGNVTNEAAEKTDLENTTAVFREKLNGWHVPKFHIAYAM